MVQGLVSDEDPPLGTRCHEGFCTGDEDPFPDSAGVWISNTVTADQCFEGGHTDADQDGLSDFCENNLAEAFAPELVLASALNDPATREPRWAARPLGNNQVMIVYLLAYHMDYGSVHLGCPIAPGCQGHPGDSEAIGLVVEYQPSTEHWLLVGAKYSNHTSYKYFETPGSYPKQLQYPGQKGGRPRAYVATGKHANYSSAASCYEGNPPYYTDHCSIDRFEIVVTGASRNVGSHAVQFQDCVTSTHPVYAPLGHPECFWSGTTFHGWTGAVGFPDPTSGYQQRMVSFGFMP
jgi:hypothetical protein